MIKMKKKTFSAAQSLSTGGCLSYLDNTECTFYISEVRNTYIKASFIRKEKKENKMLSFITKSLTLWVRRTATAKPRTDLNSDEQFRTSWPFCLWYMRLGSVPALLRRHIWFFQRHFDLIIHMYFSWKKFHVCHCYESPQTPLYHI